MRMTIPLLAAAGLLVAAGCAPERADGREVVARPAADPPPAATRAADEVPPDGPELFAFMKEKIPELAAKVPCSCCPFTIGQCYDGACPSSCGPCNAIGRDAYTWHVQGIPDDEIVARVRDKYAITR
jgi:hypothetical protein